ncbi:MAG TPA: VTT domain-containing protein [Blastocatellia bacterium]|jgi:membrane protein YqaA with SNARE-associated domain|nr:VTT domain-containing protein [Blastocatellia bacterium]
MFEWFLEWFSSISEQVKILPAYLAAPIMILIGALDSSLLSLPEVNDYITAYRVAHNPSEVYYFPLFPAIGSVIGCLILYRIAQRGEQFVTKRFHPRHLDRVKDIYRKWGIFALVIPALLPPPMPFKIFVATAGALNYPPTRFAVVIMIARTARYYFWGWVAFFFREEVLQILGWMESHVIEILGGVIALFVLSFIGRRVFTRLRSQPTERQSHASYSD